MHTNVLYCGDANVADGIALSALSVAMHTKDALSVFLFTAEVSWEDRHYAPLSPAFATRLGEMLRRYNPHATVTLTDLTETFHEDPPTANLGTRFTPLCMLRLYADTVAHLPDRLLYLDCDVICLRDFSDFYASGLDGLDLLGVPDRYGQWFLSHPFYARNYLNSGVLLLHMARIREDGLFARCRQAVRERQMLLPDQTALNRLSVKQRVKRRYNEQGRVRRTTVFKHFTTYFGFFPRFHTVTEKPWDEEIIRKKRKYARFCPLLDIYHKEKQTW